MVLEYEKWFYTYWIPSEKKLARKPVPNSKSENAVQSCENLLAPNCIAIENDFRIRSCVKLDLPSKLRAQLAIIIYFTVVDEANCFVLRMHRLTAARQINNG